MTSKTDGVAEGYLSECEAENQRLRDEVARLDSLIDKGLYAEIERLRAIVETAATMVNQADPDLSAAMLRQLDRAKAK
jgi:hypothetical protein